MAVSVSYSVHLLAHSIYPKKLSNYLVIGDRGPVYSVFLWANIIKPHTRDNVLKIKVFLPSY